MVQSMNSMEAHVRLMVGFQSKGSWTFDYGNNIRQRALDNGYARAFDFPGFVPAYIRPNSVSAEARSAGRRFQEIPRTSRSPIEP